MSTIDATTGQATGDIDADTDTGGNDAIDAESPIRVLYAGDDLSDGPTADDLADASDRFDVRREIDFVDALERVQEGDADCVVTSHRENGFDGLAFLEAVRREYAEFPVVLVSTTIDADVARRAVAADVTALVPAADADALDTVVDAVENNAVYSDESGPRMPIADLAVEAERRLKELALDEAPVGITISDADHPENPIIYENDSFAELTAYPPEETVGANHRFLQGPDTDPDRVTELARGIAENRDTRVVLRNYTRDGTMFWNEVEISPISDENGDVTHYVGFQRDVTERKRTKRQLEAKRESLDRLLDRINGLVNDVTEALVRADTREELERLTTERVGGAEEYAAAWLGRYDATRDRVEVTQHAGEGDADDASFELDDDEPGIRELRDVVESRDTRIVADPTGLPEAASGGTCVLVPLSYRSTTYGVLAVYDDEGLSDDRERILLGSLGRSVGTSINDVLTKRTMTTDTVLDIVVELYDDDLFFVRLARELDCEFEHETTMSDDNGNGTGLLALVSTDHRDAEEFVAAAESYDAVTDAETLVADEEGSIIQLRLDDSPLVDVLSEFGTRLTSMSADGTALEVGFRVGTERAARLTLDELRDTYDHVELMAYHESDEPVRTARGFREELRGRLTDRQLTALQKAHVSGYFEWPRRAEGEQLADSMGIVPSTYHQHLQAAERKLVKAFFEG